MANVLVVGGAGFIGSHMMKMLFQASHTCVAFDNLSTGFSDAVICGELIEGDLGEPDCIRGVLAGARFDCVMHFASNIEVGESVTDPRKYYTNNVINTLNLVHAMMDTGTDNLVFSSSAAVYGTPTYTPIDESHPTNPINPYGHSKKIIETILSNYRTAYSLKSTSLRYFNAAGADPESELGERHDPESHLIPLAIQTALGRRKKIEIYGSDYDTPDGTCVRDYIHVLDLCRAHLAAMDGMHEGSLGREYNLGNGAGFSVRQVINTVRDISGCEFSVVESPRREGDPAQLVANSCLAQDELGWRPSRSTLQDIVSDGWNFFESRC